MSKIIPCEGIFVLCFGHPAARRQTHQSLSDPRIVLYPGQCQCCRGITGLNEHFQPVLIAVRLSKLQQALLSCQTILLHSYP